MFICSDAAGGTADLSGATPVDVDGQSAELTNGPSHGRHFERQRLLCTNALLKVTTDASTTNDRVQTKSPQ